jgi:hypothetical protein
MIARLREFARGDWTPPRWYTLLSFVLAVVVLLCTVVGCKTVTVSPDPTRDAGVVVDRFGTAGKRKLEVERDSDGTRYWFHARTSTWRACTVSERWPECRDGAQ